MNIVDKRNGKFAETQRQNGVDDINMFVTSFVLFGLLEAKELGALKIDEHKFSQSLESILDFHDKNTPS